MVMNLRRLDYGALHNVSRKNYMFAGSHEEARNAAMIYSFVEQLLFSPI